MDEDVEAVHAPCQCAHQTQMDRIETKLNDLLVFRDVVMAAAAPYMGAKGRTWLAMLAKTKGGRT